MVRQLTPGWAGSRAVPQAVVASLSVFLETHGPVPAFGCLSPALNQMLFSRHGLFSLLRAGTTVAAT